MVDAYNNISGKTRILKYRNVLGIVFFIFGMVGLIYSIYPFGTKKVHNWGGLGPGAMLRLEIPTKIRMSETRVLRISYEDFAAPIADEIDKEVIITLYAPSFNSEPKSGERISRPVTDEIPCQWIWAIRPTEIGKHYIYLEFRGIWGRCLYDVAVELEVDQLAENSEILGIKNWRYEQLVKWENDPKYFYSLFIPIYVNDIFGLNILQAKIISTILTFLGSGFSAIWLYEKWQKRHERAKKISKDR